MTGKNIAVPENPETACLGSAILAGYGAGVFDDVRAVSKKLARIKKVYTPSGADYTECFRNFTAAEERYL